tara:strand:+ start:2977 stop:3195 length:219 start_codon:yes stop_codon:yes gene_type:complete
MFTKILLPFSLFIIIQIYICCLDIKKTEKIIANDDNKIQNYIELMKTHSDISVLMIILITVYFLFGGLLSLF